MEPWPPSAIKGKLKGIPEYAQCCEGLQYTSHKTSWACGGFFLKQSRGFRAGSVVFYLLHVLEKGLGAQLAWVMILEESQWCNTDSFPVRVTVFLQYRFMIKQGHHRINEAGRDFWREQGRLQQIAQGCVLFRFDYFQGWKLHSLCGQYDAFLYFNLCLFSSVLSLSYPWEECGSMSPTPLDWIMQS